MKLIHFIKKVRERREKADLFSRCQSVDWRCGAHEHCRLLIKTAPTVHCSNCFLELRSHRGKYLLAPLRFFTRFRHWNSSAHNIPPNIFSVVFFSRFFDVVDIPGWWWASGQTPSSLSTDSSYNSSQSNVTDDHQFNIKSCDLMIWTTLTKIY